MTFIDVVIDVSPLLHSAPTIRLQCPMVTLIVNLDVLLLRV